MDASGRLVSYDTNIFTLALKTVLLAEIADVPAGLFGLKDQYRDFMNLYLIIQRKIYLKFGN